MKPITTPITLITALTLTMTLLTPCQTISSQTCITYLQKLQTDSTTNPTLFLNEMTPYLLLSGKSLDDLGFPGSCTAVQNYSYSTVEIVIKGNETEYDGYLGFCFTSMCDVEDLNLFAGFIIRYIFAEFGSGVSGKFVTPQLQLQFSPTALATCLLFTTIILITMLAPLNHWLQLCRTPKDQSQQFQIKSVYIDLQNPNNQLEQDRITESSTFLERVSLKYKWRELWKPEISYHVVEFSLFRVLAVPLLIYGEIFWLSNYGAYNHYQFFEEIYSQTYVKLAIFAYYLPDIFFFISAFLYTKKLLTLTETPSPLKSVLKALGWRILRLYPLYLVTLVIYWCVSPYLHAGPVWYVYRNEVEVCGQAWWRVLLMIDNWFGEGCYVGLWFVQVQVQLVVVITLTFFTVYLYKPKLSYYQLSIYYLASLVLLFTLSPQIIVSIQTALDPHTELYFKSFQSHILFYLTGVIFALLSNQQSIRLAVQMYVLDKRVLNVGIKLLSAGMLVLVMVRPWVWWGGIGLELELAFCRIGTMVFFIGLFLNGIFIREKNTSVIHKYAYYMYPIILVSYMIVQSSFWSVGSFMYLSASDMVNEMIPNVLISYAVGIFLGICFDTRTIVRSSDGEGR